MIAAPATYADWQALLAARGQSLATPADMAMLWQLLGQPSWALRPALKVPPVALAGIVHREHSVIWISTTPDASRRTLAMVRVLRGLVEREARLIGRPLWAQVLDGNREGCRLVTLLGFERVGADAWRREQCRSSNRCSAATS